MILTKRHAQPIVLLGALGYDSRWTQKGSSTQHAPGEEQTADMGTTAVLSRRLQDCGLRQDDQRAVRAFITVLSAPVLPEATATWGNSSSALTAGLKYVFWQNGCFNSLEGWQTKSHARS